MKIICVGQNYLEHIKELSNVKSKEPLVFLKPDTALISKGRSFFIPNFSGSFWSPEAFHALLRDVSFARSLGRRLR